MTKDRYPVSNDVKKLNPDLADTLTVSRHRGNPATAIERLSPAKLKQLQREIGVKPESEADFATAFDDLATLRGWTWCGFRPARVKVNGVDTYRTPVIGKKGCPDRILARRGCVLLVEFKSDTGRLSPEQKEWAEALVGFPNYHVVGPKDWALVERILE